MLLTTTLLEEEGEELLWETNSGTWLQQENQIWEEICSELILWGLDLDEVVEEEVILHEIETLFEDEAIINSPNSNGIEEMMMET